MTTTPLIEQALQTEAAGLTALTEALPNLAPSLDRAVEIILALEGRLIVTGLGKSGHVATKLAATFASTGTPAYFIHPAEASHGDLGMVLPSDAILALSWSGETKELSDIIGFSKRRGVPLIALTGVADSSLARAADVALVLPKAPEACPMGLAPTTSALMQMALGDAIAVALLQLRGFSEESFHFFHPGGTLGAALKRVSEIMHLPEVLPLVSEEATVLAALSELSAKGHGIVGVLEGDALAGVITDGDVRRYLERNAGSTMKAALHETAARELMTRDPVSVPPDMLVGEVLSTLRSKRISAAFVLDETRPVGLITMLRLLNRDVA